MATEPLHTSPEQFQHLAERILALATGYLNDLDSRQIPASGNGAELEQIFRTALPETGLAEEALSDLSEVAKHSRAQNGRFFGYVLGSGEPAGAATDLLCSVL